MEDLIKFRSEYIKECDDEALLDTISSEESFINKTTEKLISAEEVEDFENCFFEKNIKNKNTRIDGYYYDMADYSFSIFISDFVGTDEIITLTNSELQRSYRKVSYFVEHSFDGFINANIEQSSLAHGVSSLLLEKKDSISKFKIYVITDKLLSQRVKRIKDKSISGIDVEVIVWDIQRLFELYVSKQQKEKITVDFTEFDIVGLKCLKACESEDYSSYLTMISGSLLSELYLNYGARLLEGNVRSFLSTRGKVNKEIRNTILTQPKMFFAYNNGIAATADKVVLANSDGDLVIKEIVNLQIINGGQTTASLANSIIKDNAHNQMKDIMVPVKLSVVEEEKSVEIIPKISETANMQNKVSGADFFSNHKYHVRIEEYSRKTFAPEKTMYDYKSMTTYKEDTRTKWFYERARGQYDQQQMQLTESAKKKFKKIHPKSQLLKKTDWAKFINTFACKPNIVSKGAQFSMNKFAEVIDREWSKSEASNEKYNEVYFKKGICYAIMFRETEKIVSNSDWYKQIKSYRANIVTYTLAYISHFIKTNHPDKTFNFSKIWSMQNVTKEFREQISLLAQDVYNFITRDDRGTTNVTEWCKKELCWLLMKKEEFYISSKYIKSLEDKVKIVEKQKQAKKERRVDNNLAVEIEVCNIGIDFWKNLKQWATERRLLTTTELSFIDAACNLEKRMPTTKQSKIILEIKKRIELEGFIA